MYKNIYEFILKNIKDFKGNLFFISLCTIISMAISILNPVIIQNLFDNGIAISSKKNVKIYLLIMLLIFILGTILNWLQFKSFIYFERDVFNKLFNQVIEHFLYLKIDYFKNKKPYQMFSEIMTDLSSLMGLFDKNLLLSFLEVFKLVGSIIGLCIINYKMALILCLIIPAKYIFNNMFSEKREILFKEYMEKETKLQSFCMDMFTGYKEIKLFLMENLLLNRVNILNKNAFKVKIDSNLMDLYYNSVNEIFINIITLIVYFIGALFIFGNTLTIGGLIVFITYLGTILSSVSTILYIKYGLSSIIPHFERFSKVMEYETEIDLTYSMTDNINIPCKIEFRNIKFEYNSNRIILDNINFIANNGEKIGIIGENGSGKTTLLNLLLKFNKATSGEILFDNKNILNIDTKIYRSIFTSLWQDFYLFNMSILNNINIQEEVDEDFILENMECFFNGLSIEKLDMSTTIGDDGINLSGGEKQKVAMIRALLRKNNILILDEPTSAFDSISEKYFNNFIAETKDFPFIFIVTHRKSILKNLDKIIYLKDGILVDYCSYKELEKYSELKLDE